MFCADQGVLCIIHFWHVGGVDSRAVEPDFKKSNNKPDAWI